jgi:hypothetical protein
MKFQAVFFRLMIPAFRRIILLPSSGRSKDGSCMTLRNVTRLHHYMSSEYTGPRLEWIKLHWIINATEDAFSLKQTSGLETHKTRHIPCVWVHICDYLGRGGGVPADKSAVKIGFIKCFCHIFISVASSNVKWQLPAKFYAMFETQLLQIQE